MKSFAQLFQKRAPRSARPFDKLRMSGLKPEQRLLKEPDPGPGEGLLIYNYKNFWGR